MLAEQLHDASDAVMKSATEGLATSCANAFPRVDGKCNFDLSTMLPTLLAGTLSVMHAQLCAIVVFVLSWCPRA